MKDGRMIMKKPPRYKHQKKVLEISKDLPAYAFLMEMGTAKTRPIIDTAEHLHKKKKIEALFVFAPNGVQRNWILNELPKWTDRPYRATWWTSNPNKKQQAELDAVVGRPYDGLRIIAANYESSRSLKFKVFVKKFLRSFKTMLVLDESTRIKTPAAKQTKFIVSLRRYSNYRRIMSGLVTPNSPFDIYKQFEFLDPNILGFGSFYAFKAHFAEIEDNQFMLNAIKKKNKERAEASRAMGENKHYSTRAPQLVKKNKITGLPMYRNLDELAELIAPYSFRVLKSECLDLPEKVYMPPLLVELTSKQRSAYDTVRDELIAEFEDGSITTALAIVKMIRLQQITGGFWSLDDEKAKPIDGKFPKLDAIMETIEDIPGKSAIWTHFTWENEKIADVLREAYGYDSVVQYYGKINNKNKQLAVDRFSNIVRDAKGKQHQEDTGARFWVGEPHSGGIGLELITAEAAFYYSNTFNLEDRLQSEDRHHRSGLRHVVSYFDAQAEDTIDQAIVGSLRNKLDISTIINRDNPRSWM
jgi:SNF2 family DNA or RNA helicase